MEGSFSSGTGKIQLTGQLGEVMKESAQTALSFVRTRSDELGLPKSFFGEHDFHIHAPAGAIPKDGPSAGITFATALISLVTGVPVNRDFAMTGEITLTGRVLPVGGIKEKVLAAVRQSVHQIIMPRACEKDLVDLPKAVRSKLKIHLVDHIDEVLQLALKRAHAGTSRGKVKARRRASMPQGPATLQ
jgi:ATP-dependent Lon protease